MLDIGLDMPPHTRTSIKLLIKLKEVLMCFGPSKNINKFLILCLNQKRYLLTQMSFLDLHLSISNDIVSTKIYDKRDDFDIEIVNW